MNLYKVTRKNQSGECSQIVRIKLIYGNSVSEVESNCDFEIQAIEIQHYDIVLPLKTLKQAWGEWTDETFYQKDPGDIPLRIAYKLQEENNELLNAIGYLLESPTDHELFNKVQMELADNFGLILDLANKLKISADDLIKATTAKLEINKGRSWKANTARTFEHVKD